MKIGYGRAADKSHARSQRAALRARGCERVYIDFGLIGRDPRPDLDKALATCAAGDTLAVAELVWLARSIPDALAITTRLAEQRTNLEVGDTLYDWSTRAGKAFLTDLTTIAKFQTALTAAATREGVALARQQGRRRGRQPSLTVRQDRFLRVRYDTDPAAFNVTREAKRLGVSRPTIHRSLKRTSTED